MKIRISDGTTEIRVTLIDSALTSSLVNQLPLTLPLTDYGHNEKYVKPPKKLATDKKQEKECPGGSLGYFAPWNNLCLFFGKAPAYPGQYLLGLADGNAEEMRKLSGEVIIEIA